MNESAELKIRLGIVDFLNTAPIHEKLKNSSLKHKWDLVVGPPVLLNKKLSEAQLDVSFVSTIEYGRRPELYRILSGLSISALGPAGSVFLFSHLPISQLDKEAVLLTLKSETSIALGKLLVEEINGVYPAYSVGNVLENQSAYKAVLATGNEALTLLEEAKFLYQYDLGDMWKRETGLPFVYSVCAVREEFCKEHPQALSVIHKELLRCRDDAGTDINAICDVSAGRIPFTKARCREYLNSIAYDLKADKRKSVEIFFECLSKRGDIKPLESPLKIFANLDEIL